MFKKLSGAAKTTGAVLGIVANLGTVPVTKDGTPTLTKQYAKHAKEVRLSETRRRISRDITKTPTPAMALDKRVGKRLRKP